MQHEEPTSAGGTTSPGALPRLVSAWVHGWALSRGTPAPTVCPGGWRIAVGLHAHRLRYVLHEHDEQALARLSGHHKDPGTWIKAAAEPASLRAALPPEWKTAEPGYLMTAKYRAASDKPPPRYTTRVQTVGQVISAEVLGQDGRIAASGRLAVAGTFGIIDQVETGPEHRRRGLGSAVMHTLALHGLRLGADSGVLVATNDGRNLYRSLGWSVATPIAAAYVPEQ